MSAKRPRPAIPVLVHVDNPTEAASITVDTSTIEGKMDTVITNQNRIYDKIPTSTGGGATDLTTVNEKITSLAETIGPSNSTLHDSNLFGRVRNLVSGVGDFDIGVSGSGTTVRALLYNIRDGVGDKFNTPTATGNSVRDLLFALKTATGTTDSAYTDNDLLGKVKNLVLAVGEYGGVLSESATGLRSLLYNVRQSVGDSTKAPSATGTTVRDLLAAIKRNTESGDDLTTVNEKITAINTAVGDGAAVSNDQSLIGLAKGIKASLGSMSTSDTKSSSNIKGRLYNIQSSIGDALNSPSPTGTSVRDLLAAIKQNTASGGGGSSADLTTVNEKTTALAAAIGSASDDSSTVSVIGLLKSITDKY